MKIEKTSCTFYLSCLSRLTCPEKPARHPVPSTSAASPDLPAQRSLQDILYLLPQLPLRTYLPREACKTSCTLYLSCLSRLTCPEKPARHPVPSTSAASPDLPAQRSLQDILYLLPQLPLQTYLL
ncbi:hypothetical protein BgiBS90_033805 [Biomphalaria glabrata]|nr:hypothetical protein BgiBS90_033805 [Biomphalaria glabrata]